MDKDTSRSSGSWPSYRGAHRRRADAEAHAATAEAPPVLDHPLVFGGPPRLVETQGDLGALVGALRAAGRFAYDAEFIGEETFYPRFCVIQVATAEEITLIDALAAGLDLRPFWELIADPAVEVVVHAGFQDLEPVHRLTGRPPAHVFDTQIAAGFIGLAYPMALKKLVTAVTGAELGTSSKFSQWDRRPLSAVQQAYAANDVRYLLLLRQRLGERLAELGHADKARAEFEPLSDPATYRADPLTMKLKARGGSTLRRREQAVLNALLLWRAGEARARDVPMRALLEDQVLVDLARQPVESVADVKGFKGMPWPVKEAYAEALVALTAEALAGPRPKRGRSYKALSDAAQARLESVWTQAIATCEAVSISPSIAMTKQEVTALVRAQAAGKALPPSRLTRGWRGELLRPVFEAVAEMPTPPA